MSSAELAAEIERIRPPDPAQVAEADPAVIEARKAAEGLSGQREAAAKEKAQAERQEAVWRQEHPRRAALHDRGWWPSAELKALAEHWAPRCGADDWPIRSGARIPWQPARERVAALESSFRFNRDGLHP